MVHLAGAFRYFMPMDGGTVFFLLVIYRHFSTFEKLWLQYKVGFSFKTTKNRQQFFSAGGRGLRVSSHLCVLGAILRVPWANVANLTKSVSICLWMLTTLTPSANGTKQYRWGTFPKCEAKLPYHLLVGPLFWGCLHPNPLGYTKGPPISRGKIMLVWGILQLQGWSDPGPMTEPVPFEMN